MGMGDFPAGFGPAGVDPVYKPAPPSIVSPPAAIFYDPSIRQYNPAVIVDPIDQIVASRCTSQKNQSASSPDLGTRLRSRFAQTPPSQHAQIAFQEFTAVLADLIAAGDVTLLGVKLNRFASNGAEVAIPNYVNNRNPNASQVYPTPGSGGATLP